MIQERKLFSNVLRENDGLYSRQILGASVSERDAAKRIETYGNLFGQYEKMKQKVKRFSTSYGDNQLIANQYFNASVTGLAKSFAGYLTIERLLDAPEALFWFYDVLEVTSGNIVMPNVGVENLGNYKYKMTATEPLVTGTASYSVATGKKLIPGTVTVKVNHPGGVAILNDDKQGNLIAAGGILAAGSVIDYANGDIDIVFTAGFAGTFVTGTSTADLVSFEDQVATANINRFKLQTRNIKMVTAPELLVGETDLFAIAGHDKVLGDNPEDVMAAKLVELYVKIANNAMVEPIIQNNIGNDVHIDVSGTGYGDYVSILNTFTGGLVDVNKSMAGKSSKGVKATAYLCGENTAAWFEKTAQTGNFVEAGDRSYVNDLVGFYKGIPVLRHDSVGDNEGYAIHKTADGNLAPVGRGLFLPLTNTPKVGNFENPSNLAEGVYYSEAHEILAPQLVQKFILQP